MLRLTICLLLAACVSLSYAHPAAPSLDDQVEETAGRAQNIISAAIKQASLTATSNNNNDGCAFNRFIIDFEKLGLDFVLSPSSIDIGICGGSCANAKLANAYEYMLNVGGVKQSKNCIADGFKELKIMYRDEDTNNIRVAVVPDMMATSCRCA